jgi:hypothetical protein
MSWTFTAEVARYAQAVGPLLGADPAGPAPRPAFR